MDGPFMKLVLYQMKECPFCKHFRRMFYRDHPEGEEIMLDGHEDPGWVELGLNYVPTVIAYDDDGNEIKRLESVKLVGIRKDRWKGWIEEFGIFERI
jgi:glutaredoxin